LTDDSVRSYNQKLFVHRETPQAMPQSRRKFVAGNWKMNGSLASAGALASALAGRLAGFTAADVVVFPAAPHLAAVAAVLEGSAIRLGAQNASEHAAGAYTGESSVAMLAELGCGHVLVGHSERRALFGETNAQVAAKFVAVATGELVPVLCVGETLAEREAGTTEAVIAGQLEVVLKAASIAQLAASVIAYEPVWAIGTGKTASPEQAQQVHAFIRTLLTRHDAAFGAGVRIVYGGSVSAATASGLFACPDIDGGLVGGASLKVDDFIAICNAASL
jgi:triosephosphate isomerase (TIM)